MADKETYTSGKLPSVSGTDPSDPRDYPPYCDEGREKGRRSDWHRSVLVDRGKEEKGRYLPPDRLPI